MTQEFENIPPGPPNNEGTIEGGDVVGADEAIEAKPSHRERTASTLALSLLWIFGGALVLHYVCLLIVLDWGDREAADIIQKQFNAWLPVLSGLVGSAVTYYLTKEKP